MDWQPCCRTIAGKKWEAPSPRCQAPEILVLGICFRKGYQNVFKAFEESRIGQSAVKAVFFNGQRIGILEPTSKTEQITVAVGVTYLFQ
jgi:hypothetical protein